MKNVKREDKPWTRRKYPKKTYLRKDCKICKEISKLKNRTTNSHTKNRQKILEDTSSEKIRAACYAQLLPLCLTL